MSGLDWDLIKDISAFSAIALALLTVVYWWLIGRMAPSWTISEIVFWPPKVTGSDGYIHLPSGKPVPVAVTISLAFVNVRFLALPEIIQNVSLLITLPDGTNVNFLPYTVMKGGSFQFAEGHWKPLEEERFKPFLVPPRSSVTKNLLFMSARGKENSLDGLSVGKYKYSLKIRKLMQIDRKLGPFEIEVKGDDFQKGEPVFFWGPKV